MALRILRHAVALGCQRAGPVDAMPGQATRTPAHRSAHLSTKVAGIRELALESVRESRLGRLAIEHVEEQRTCIVEKAADVVLFRIIQFGVKLLVPELAVDVNLNCTPVAVYG